MYVYMKHTTHPFTLLHVHQFVLLSNAIEWIKLLKQIWVSSKERQSIVGAPRYS